MSKLWAGIDRCALIIGALCTLGCLWYTRAAFLDGHPQPAQASAYSKMVAGITISGPLAIALVLGLLAAVALALFFALRRAKSRAKPRHRQARKPKQPPAPAKLVEMQITLVVASSAIDASSRHEDIHLVECPLSATDGPPPDLLSSAV